jgi:hypothetical protein
VIYCAFEGGHGFKSRIEAQRRHYRELGQIDDHADVPMHIMSGQAKLIAEHAKLIAEFKLQLGDVVPKLVVLDTLNRSIDGSESKDVDMTSYVRAAEAVRSAFGCIVIIVHHCGYDDSHARGHTSLAAAVDGELSITRQAGTALCEVVVKHLREGPEDTKVVSKARIISLDPDKNGRPRSSIVLTPTDEAIDPTAGKGGRPDEAAQVLHRSCVQAWTTKTRKDGNIMASNSSSVSTLKNAHTSAEVGGVSGLPGVPTAPGNAGTTWSRYAARAAYANGQISQGQYVIVMNALAGYEQVTYQTARDNEGSTGMLPQ